MSAEFERDRAYLAGSAMWPETYKARPDDDHHAVGALRSKFSTLDLSQRLTLLSCARWVDGACRTIQTDAKYFAAMANTSIGLDAVSELRVPWPAFMVEWPEGLCISERGHDYTTAFVLQTKPFMGTCEADAYCEFTHGRPWSYIGLVDRRGRNILTRFADVTLAHLLFAREYTGSEDLFGGDDRSEGEKAAMAIVCRAIAGLLYTLQHTRNWRPSPFPSSIRRGRLRESPPPHRVVIVGKPLELDATQNVRDRVAGLAGSNPAVQTLVRGHIKRQVVGPGRSARRVIWIEPYWRGPEDALILSRPYAVTRPPGGAGQ